MIAANPIRVTAISSKLSTNPFPSPLNAALSPSNAFIGAPPIYENVFVKSGSSILKKSSILPAK